MVCWLYHYFRVLSLEVKLKLKGSGVFSSPLPFYLKINKMTMDNGRTVSLSFKDWLGLITLVLTVTGIMVGCWVQSLRMLERMDATIEAHSQRIQRIETQLDHK